MAVKKLVKNNNMRKIIFLILAFACLNTNASDQNCFKIGEQWHDFKLPDDMKNVRWLFGGDEEQNPFMSVSFDIDNAAFDSWVKVCGVKMQAFGKNRFWDGDIDTGGLSA